MRVRHVGEACLAPTNWRVGKPALRYSIKITIMITIKILRNLGICYNSSFLIGATGASIHVSI